jgi:hypothetical protein
MRDVLENRKLRRMFGSKEEEVTGGRGNSITRRHNI